MHFKEFNKSYLFIDPTDEAVWRCYEKQYEKTIAIENESIKILFDSPFTGDIKLNNRNITVLNPTKCIKTNLKDINTITDINIKVNTANMNTANMNVELNSQKYSLNRISVSLINEVLVLDPNCIHALKLKMKYSTDREEKRSILNKLKELDPMRQEYYKRMYNTSKAYYELIKAQY
jgi:hypothetical protein